MEPQHEPGGRQGRAGPLEATQALGARYRGILSRALCSFLAAQGTLCSGYDLKSWLKRKALSWLLGIVETLMP